MKIGFENISFFCSKENVIFLNPKTNQELLDLHKRYHIELVLEHTYQIKGDKYKFFKGGPGGFKFYCNVIIFKYNNSRSKNERDL